MHSDMSAIPIIGVQMFKAPFLFGDETEVTEIHARIFSTLLPASTCCLLFSGTIASNLQACVDPFVQRKTKEGLQCCFPIEQMSNWIRLFNAANWRRPTIGIRVKLDWACLKSTFDGSVATHHWSTVAQAQKSHTRGVLRYCLNDCEHGIGWVCFPSSVGVQWVDIIVSDSERDMLFRTIG